MKRRIFLSAAALIAARLGFAPPAQAASASGWESVTLKEALEKRASKRGYAAKELDDALLLDMLWAGFGINRPGSAKRTAPSSWNRQEVDIYVVQQSGVRLYDAQSNSLKPYKDGDLRALTGSQGFVTEAPVNLVFVADLAKLSSGHDPETVLPTAWADTSFISQNVYLFCAAAGLATVVRAYVDRPALAEALGLEGELRITMAQSVGYPS